MNHDITVYLNGEYLPISEAKVSVLDRGFIFADGVYEVIPIYGRRPFRLHQHLDRLSNGLKSLQIPAPFPDIEITKIIEKIVSLATSEDQSIYLQITRGVAPRDHAFPGKITPTVFIMSNPLTEPDIDTVKGINAITLDDIRWQWCHLKTISLLPNVLLRQQAYDQDASEALLIRDGMVTEGAASNLLIVKNGEIITPPKDHQLLPGVTRDLIIEIAARDHLPYRERSITLEELQQADEIWISSSTKEIVPIIQLDGIAIGNGQPGPVWRGIVERYRKYKDDLRLGVVD